MIKPKINDKSDDLIMANTTRKTGPMLASLTLSLLAGCYGTQTGNTDETRAEIDPCEAINTLTTSYQQQFADIRKARRSHDRISIWSTSYQVVGSGCEIWGWQGGNYNYVCNYVAPDEQSARDIYARAKTAIESCLSNDWQLRETALVDNPGSKALFQKPDYAAVIDLRLVQTRGISTPRWAIYLMIGDYNSQL